MFGTHTTFRWLVAAHTALWLPVCWCDESLSSHSQDDRAAHVQEDDSDVDRDHGRPSGNDHPSDQPEPGHHGGTGDSTCSDSDYLATAPETSGGLRPTVQVTQLPIAVVSFVANPAIPPIQSAEHVPRPTTSLLQQHCALVV